MLRCIILAVLVSLGNSQALCGGEIRLTKQNGYSALLQSPAFPGDYPNNQFCTWKIVGEPGYGIIFIVDEFKTEGGETPGAGCEFDGLRINELIGGKVGAPVGVFCDGLAKDYRIRASSSEVRAVFYSDAGSAGRFSIRVEKQKCQSAFGICPSSKPEDDKCFQPDMLCNGVADCPGGIDEVCPKGCGIQEKKPLLSTRSAARIIGGIQAQPNSWPWTALLYSQEGEHICGGTIIDHRWVVTAASCCRPGLKIRVGEHDLDGSLEKNVWTYNVQTFYKHDDFSKAPLNVVHHDICLLRTTVPILFNEDVSPVCLGSGKAPEPGTTCYVTGWGNSQSGTASVLRQVDVKIQAHEACNTAHKGVITEDMICAFSKGNGGCQKDIGGPLVCASRADPLSYDLVGIVSWARSCSDSSQADVYTKTGYFMDWISGVIWAAN